MNASNRQPTIFWHQRFLQQAIWTESIRHKLLGLPELMNANTILEVGSGTGVILKEINDRLSAEVIGLDLNWERLKFGRRYAPRCQAVNGDGMRLPFMTDSLDIAVCHFLLLWVKDPLSVLREMVRVTRPQGWVMALAEPDYGGRIDHPPHLVEFGRLQTESLNAQGADPELGRRMMSLFLEAGVSDITTGVLGGEWQSASSSQSERENEWAVLLSDLGDAIQPAQLADFKQDWLQEGRILYVPTFYAFGKVPG